MNKIDIKMNTFKKKTLVVCGIFMIIMIAVMCLHKQYSDLKRIRLDEISDYLSECFVEPMDITNISIIDGCYAICNPKDNTDLKFRVEYWTNKNMYIDTYCQNHLEYEAKQLIENQLQDRLNNFNCSVLLNTMPPIEEYEKLYKYYRELNRPLSWLDDICDEALAYIQIVDYNDSVDESIAYEIIRLIDEVPIRYKRIVISESDKIILDINK